MSGRGLDRKRINVTQENIEESTRENSAKCMVASALKGNIAGCKKTHVDMQTMRFTDVHGIRRTYLTPAAVQAALVRYDAGDPVEPFSFNLPSAIHLSKPNNAVKSHATRRSVEVAPGHEGARARIGGKAIPMMGNATRRRFGIRNLRINAEGKVEQLGVEK